MAKNDESLELPLKSLSKNPGTDFTLSCTFFSIFIGLTSIFFPQKRFHTFNFQGAKWTNPHIQKVNSFTQCKVKGNNSLILLKNIVSYTNRKVHL